MLARVRLLVTSLLVLGSFACTSSGGHNSLVGETCKTSAECDVTGICVTDGPDGLCTLPCIEPGAAGECPLGAYCDRESLTSDSAAKSEMTLCLPSCKADSDCRTGYACNALSSGPGKVCQPK
jgi:hypothetical protein